MNRFDSAEHDRPSTRSDDLVCLVVLIVNFRTPRLTIQCLETLEAAYRDFPHFRAIVVENGSGDDSAERIGESILERGWQHWAQLEIQDENYGFAGGNARALEAAPASEYVLMLNSDTLVHAGCLEYCCDLMRAEPDIGAMSCLLLNADGSVQNVTRKFPNPLRLSASIFGLVDRFPRLFAWANIQDLAWDRRNLKRDVDWIGGAFLMTRKDLVDRIGLLDEDFFFYGEDVEFSFRVWRAGYRCHYDPQVSTTHLGGGSAKDKNLDSKLRWRARYQVQRKCYGRAAELFIRVSDLVAWSLKCTLRRLRHGADDPQTLEAQSVVGILRQWQ